MVAVAAPVTMLVAPGPTERDAGQRRQPARWRTPVAAWTIACSFRPWWYGSSRPAALLSSASPEAGHVAVAEDAEHALDEPVLHAVTLAALRDEEADDRLPTVKPQNGHVVLPSAVRPDCHQPRSTASSAQVSRIHA